MERLVNKKNSKILLLVEGERLEKEVFSEISKVYNFDVDIYCLRCNIYMLYDVMKDYGFAASIKDILIEKLVDDISDENIEVLMNNKFAYTYLIMDLDIQHYKNDIYKALGQVEEMAEYFKDETDDTIGKLYINYPMMESFRDREGFIDDKFIDKTIKVEECVNYKRIAGDAALSAIHINQYKEFGFNNIVKSNLNKVFVKLFNIAHADYQQ